LTSRLIVLKWTFFLFGTFFRLCSSIGVKAEYELFSSLAALFKCLGMQFSPFFPVEFFPGEAFAVLNFDQSVRFLLRPSSVGPSPLVPLFLSHIDFCEFLLKRSPLLPDSHFSLVRYGRPDPLVMRFGGWGGVPSIRGSRKIIWL